MISHGTTFQFSRAMSRHCDHVHSSLFSRHATKRLSNALNIHLKQMYMLYTRCQLTQHAECSMQQLSCHTNFAQTQIGSHARCCCMQLLTSIATVFIPNGITFVWDYSMLRPTWQPPPFVANLVHCPYAARRAHCQPSHLLACVPASAVLSLSVLHPAQKASPHIKPTLSGVSVEEGRQSGSLWQVGRLAGRQTHTQTDRHTDNGRSQRDAQAVRQVGRYTDRQTRGDRETANKTLTHKQHGN